MPRPGRIVGRTRRSLEKGINPPSAGGDTFRGMAVPATGWRPLQVPRMISLLRAPCRLAGLLLSFGLLLPPVWSGVFAKELRSVAQSRAEKIARARASYYRVRRGDTLSRIARKFRTSAAVLVRWNRLKGKQEIRAGSRLLVPGPKVVPRKRVARRAARRAAHKATGAMRRGSRRLTPGEIEKSSWHSTKSGTALFLPSDFSVAPAKERRFAHKLLEARLYARTFSQGEAACLEIRRGTRLPGGALVRARFADAEVPLTKTSYGYRALVAFSPYRRPGREKLELSVVEGKATTRLTFSIAIGRGDFKTVVWKSFLGNYDRPPRVLTAAERRAARERARAASELLRKSTRKKKEAFARRTDDKLGPRLAHPRGHHIVTDPFFVSRKIVQYYVKNRRRHWKKPFIRKHHGLDLHGKTGAPIYALADGVVVAAQRMFYEGNFTVIDHGRGVFTGYMHQDKMLVKDGDRVNAGQLIGRVGATGRVTGPHLHAGLYIRDVPVHPLSLLVLPIR